MDLAQIHPRTLRVLAASLPLLLLRAVLRRGAAVAVGMAVVGVLPQDRTAIQAAILIPIRLLVAEARNGIPPTTLSVTRTGR